MQRYHPRITPILAALAAISMAAMPAAPQQTDARVIISQPTAKTDTRPAAREERRHQAFVVRQRNLLDSYRYAMGLAPHSPPRRSLYTYHVAVGSIGDDRRKIGSGYLKSGSVPGGLRRRMARAA